MSSTVDCLKHEKLKLLPQTSTFSLKRHVICLYIVINIVTVLLYLHYNNIKCLKTLDRYIVVVFVFGFFIIHTP